MRPNFPNTPEAYVPVFFVLVAPSSQSSHALISSILVSTPTPTFFPLILTVIVERAPFSHPLRGIRSLDFDLFDT